MSWLGANLGGNVLAVRNIKKVRDLSHQIVFVRADLVVDIGDLPHVFDDADLLCFFQLAVDEGRELDRKSVV